jgi:hypothetical protein
VWPVSTVVAAQGIPAWQVVVPGVIALVATVAAAWLALRGTFRQAQTNHEVEFDKLVHARIAALEKQVAEKDTRIEVVTGDRDRYREMYAQLRLDVLAAGLNPDRLGKGDGDAPPAP